MKLLKRIIPLIFLLTPCLAFAQPEVRNDTIAVLIIRPKGHPLDTLGFIKLTKGQRVYCWVHDTVYIEGKIRRFTNDSIAIDSVTYSLKSIRLISTFTTPKRILLGGGAILIAASSVFVPLNYYFLALAGITFGSIGVATGIGQSTSDIRSFKVTTHQDFMAELDSCNWYKRVKAPPGRKDSSHRYKLLRIPGLRYTYNKNAILFDKVYAHRSSMDYLDIPNCMRDTTIMQKRHMEFSKRHFIGVSIFDVLANEISLTYGYRISRAFGLDISPGIYFQTNSYCPAIPFLNYHRIDSPFSLTPNNFKGGQVRLTWKIYGPKRPNRYMGLECLFRYINYSQRLVVTDISYDPSYTSGYRCQSEESTALGLLFKLGWQTTFRRGFSVDFYTGFGALYRQGYISFYSKYYDWSTCSWYLNQNSPAFHTAAFFPCIQAGMKVGVRFGHGNS